MTYPPPEDPGESHYPPYQGGGQQSWPQQPQQPWPSQPYQQPQPGQQPWGQQQPGQQPQGRPPYGQMPYQPGTQPPQQYPGQQQQYVQQQAYPPPGGPQYGQPAAPGYPPQRPPRRRSRKSWPARHKVLATLGSITALIVIAVAASAGHHPAPVAAPAAAVTHTASPASTVLAKTKTKTKAKPAAKSQVAAKASPRKPAAQTITYTVTGTAGTQVTYGPAGTELTGAVPMKITGKLGDPAYYSVTAQLQGGGEVACSIAVDGKVISRGTATGGYNIAMCEIITDPLSGEWESAAG
jgi:hypothetical protein